MDRRRLSPCRRRDHTDVRPLRRPLRASRDAARRANQGAHLSASEAEQALEAAAAKAADVERRAQQERNALEARLMGKIADTEERMAEAQARNGAGRKYIMCM